MQFAKYSQEIDLPSVSTSINSITQGYYLPERSSTTFINSSSLDYSQHNIEPTEIVRAQKSDNIIKPIYEAVFLNRKPSEIKRSKFEKGSRILFKY